MDEIYLGRIVAIGRNRAGALAAMYRVSSRSFPNRCAQQADAAVPRVSIVPKEGHENDVFRNPYIAYHCAMVVGERVAIVSNGSHTDPIAEKLATGMSPRDALIYGLAALDYEKDDYNTPRIAALVQLNEAEGWLGVVRQDGLDVRAFTLAPGECIHLSTYEHDVPLPERRSVFDATDAAGACRHILGEGIFAQFTNPVTAVSLFATEDSFAVAIQDSE